jgi:hypothetical protein
MKKYYMGLAFFGIVTELVVAVGITGLRSIEEVQWSPFLGGFILSVLSAIAATFSTADYLSRQPYSVKLFPRLVFNPFLIFVSGVVASVIVNFFYQGLLLNSDLGIAENFHSWFIKPFYWIMLIGGPFSIAVGLIYYPLSIVLENFRKN